MLANSIIKQMFVGIVALYAVRTMIYIMAEILKHICTLRISSWGQMFYVDYNYEAIVVIEKSTVSKIHI